MKIKAKLTLGVGLLFALILMLAFNSVQKVYVLAAETKNILVANYNSLDYARKMLLSLEGSGAKHALDEFDENLRKQESNITEVGEAEMTQKLRQYFDRYKLNHHDTAVVGKMRKEVNDLMRINLDAIQRKSAVAEKTADSAVFWLSILGTFCFLIAFILLFNLPSNIANPIRELTESIKQIAAGNYTQRIQFRSGSEFGELAESFNVMAKKLEEYNNSNLASLMTEKKRIETLINNMHDPVIGLDEEHRVLFANEEALKITGLKAAAVLGKSALKLSVTNDLIRSLIQDLVVEKNGVRPVSGEVSMKIFADGKESYFEKELLNIEVTPTGEKTPRSIGHVILLRNVTAYKELDSAKTNFIATISHEFKTPISSIKMSVQLLENGHIGSLNEEQKSLLHGIQEDTARLLKITGELLNMTQVETGNIQLTVMPADAKEIFVRAIEANRNTADQKKIRLEQDFPENLPLVLADSDKSTWVMTNLISNAIRHSYDNASIYLSIRPTKSGMEFMVKDTGQGIPPQYVQRVFDRYFRVPGSVAEGTGLGLAISKEFIEAQGGKITVESDFGAGSTFKVTLQMALE